MPLPIGVEGRVASLSDLMDTTVDIGAGSITIDTITSNNRVLHTGQIGNISKDTLTTVTTMPANGIKYITKVVCSGEENAKWDIFIDSVRKCSKRTRDRERDLVGRVQQAILRAEI